jgi:hypothetical protein
VKIVVKFTKLTFHSVSGCYFNRRDVNNLGWSTAVCDSLNKRGEGLELEEKFSEVQMHKKNKMDIM